MLLRLHSPEQISAFYEARGFPPGALERIRETCFITVHIDNKGDDVLWLETANWRITRDNQPVERLGQAYWDRVWDEIDLPRAKRSTFSWPSSMPRPPADWPNRADRPIRGAPPQIRDSRSYFLQ